MESRTINPEIKSKINKIDFELKKYFDNVYIAEKFYKTGFFEITANKVSYIKESKDYKRLEVRVIINHPDLMNDDIRWSYSTNPLIENTLWIDRFSNVSLISEDIIQIVKEKRFDESYLLALESIVDMINESNHTEEEKNHTLLDTYSELLKKFAVNVTMEQSEVHSVNENFMKEPSDRIIRYYHNSDLKVSDMFKIESAINAVESTNWCIFKEGFVEINYTPEF